MARIHLADASAPPPDKRTIRRKAKGPAKQGLSRKAKDVIAEAGYEPLEGMIEIAKDREGKIRGNTLRLRFECMRELAQYIHPKLKSTETTATVSVEQSAISREALSKLSVEELATLDQIRAKLDADAENDYDDEDGAA